MTGCCLSLLGSFRLSNVGGGSRSLGTSAWAQPQLWSQCPRGPQGPSPLQFISVIHEFVSMLVKLPMASGTFSFCLSVPLTLWEDDPGSLRTPSFCLLKGNQTTSQWAEPARSNLKSPAMPRVEEPRRGFCCLRAGGGTRAGTGEAGAPPPSRTPARDRLFSLE